MFTGKPRDAAKERFWRRMVRRWQASGLSVRAYCAQHRLSQPAFYAWRRTLAQRDAEAARFIPVHVVGDEKLAARDASGQGLELLLSPSRVLRIGPGFDGPTLGRLLALLEEGRL
jgi:hypothetical protein